jgi:hypothetical protein
MSFVVSPLKEEEEEEGTYMSHSCLCLTLLVVVKPSFFPYSLSLHSSFFSL